MNKKPKGNKNKSPLRAKIESTIKHWIQRTKALHGEPRYVAMGMAVGVFVSATPTIPFQTLIAVALAFILRGSKAAAAIGVWLSNPFTFPVFYLASYKTGAFLFGTSDFHGIAGQTMSDLLKLGSDITLAAFVGGIIIGTFLAVGAYMITLKIVTKIRSREKRGQRTESRRQRTEDPSSPDSFAAAGRGPKTENRKQKTEDRGPIAPTLTTANTDPNCEYSSAIFCQQESKDQRPGT
jgi:uncharacterized protein (DUF2062 family)